MIDVGWPFAKKGRPVHIRQSTVRAPNPLSVHALLSRSGCHGAGCEEEGRGQHDLNGPHRALEDNSRAASAEFKVAYNGVCAWPMTVDTETLLRPSTNPGLLWRLEL
jgi:hypothetical protein